MNTGAYKFCARAPVRVDAAGGGTDAPPYCLDHGGAVLNFTIDRHAYAFAQKLKPGSGVMIHSLDQSETISANDFEQLRAHTELEFLRAFLLRLVPPEDSVLLVTDTDVPAGSGLGGSGALGVAVVAALDRLYGRERTPAETAALANSIERDDLGYPGGSQDSYGAAFGGVNLLRFLPNREVHRSKLNLDADTLRALEYRSLLIYCGAGHVSATIHEDIRNSYSQENSPTLQAMHRLRELAEQLAPEIQQGNLECFAKTLSDSCRQLYHLHESCDSEAHRTMLRALEPYIDGRKTCGAGGGGFLIAFVRPECRQQCLRRAEELGGMVWPVKLDFDGLLTWREPALSSQAIERLRSE